MSSLKFLPQDNMCSERWLYLLNDTFLSSSSILLLYLSVDHNGYLWQLSIANILDARDKELLLSNETTIGRMQLFW